VTVEDAERMEEQGLIERRRPRSHMPKSALFRLTAKGAAAKSALR